MDQILGIMTTTNQVYKFKIITMAWAHQSDDLRYIEIAGKETQGPGGTMGYSQLVHIKSTGDTEYQRRLSEFHDKLFEALGKFNTQITAYANVASLPQELGTIDLRRQFVYLITDFSGVP